MKNSDACNPTMLALIVVIGFVFLLSPVSAQSQTRAPRDYDPGNPSPIIELWVDPVNGDDGNDGLASNRAVRGLFAAWNLVPVSLTTHAYRINILPGAIPCYGDCINYFDNRHGTYAHPLIIRAMNGAGTVTLQGGLNLASVDYLYLYDLTIQAGGAAGAFANNVLHCDQCDHVLLRGLTITGLTPGDFQEVFKANQSDYLYLENSDLSGTYQTVLDYFAVRSGHILNSRFHNSGEWCMYVKGGSAYLRVEGNELFDCRFGFSAGEGSNFEVMQSPWLHYEAYDIKFVNNILRDIVGLGLRAAGGYNILFAHNTLYRVATDASVGYSLVHATRGGRGCIDFSENGVGNAFAICNGFLNAGGWGTASEGYAYGGEWIPNRSVFVYNNIFYNPAPLQTLYSHFYIPGAITPPAHTRNIPNPSRVDVNLQIRGNIIWNGSTGMPLGIEDSSQGCQPSNATCNATQLRADNSINTIEPQFLSPATGNFRPTPGGNVFSATTFAIPDFSWSDAPTAPVVPAGNLSNAIPRDRAGSVRASPSTAGAYTAALTAHALFLPMASK
ncbi:MAG: right-handed parallel beta-helix repeat-containing protein [Chloroflexi bacterium]|nr:right-handed parallel beta-helix repeat-containing protein [Chloroflexota bacterium]